MHRIAALGAIAVCLVAFSGCRSWPWHRAPQTPTSPQLFQDEPTLAELIGAVNANTDRVNQLQADSVTLSLTGAPILRGNLKFERPKNFRMIAGLTQLTGSEVDVGSNSELFWVWIKRMDQIYYARHEEFVNSPARTAVPLEPSWLVEAIGLPRFDAGDRHEGPIDRGNNQYEIRSYLSGANRGKTKVTIIDGAYGWVLSQAMYDEKNQLAASAIATEHRYYAGAGVVLPATVEINLPTAGQTARIDVAEYTINQLTGDPARLWAMPETTAEPLDLSKMSPPQGPPGGTPQSIPTDDGNQPAVGRALNRLMPNRPRIGFRPQIRGYEESAPR